jgi:hypothetical protein
VIYGTALPFFGDVLIGSSETALGGTIFTAALADCGLVKKAMVDREVKRRKKEQGVRWRGEVNRHPQRHARSSLAHPGPPCRLLRGMPQH